MTSYWPYISGSGGALAVLAIGIYLLIAGKLHTDAEFQRILEENQHLKEALETERTTSNELARSGGVAAKALDALVEVATGRRSQQAPPVSLTGEDLGL